MIHLVTRHDKTFGRRALRYHWKSGRNGLELLKIEKESHCFPADSLQNGEAGVWRFR